MLGCLVGNKCHPVVDRADEEDKDGFLLGVLEFGYLVLDPDDVIITMHIPTEGVLDNVNPNFSTFFIVDKHV